MEFSVARIININIIFICLGSAISAGPDAASGPPPAGAAAPSSTPGELPPGVRPPDAGRPAAPCVAELVRCKADDGCRPNCNHRLHLTHPRRT